MATLRVSAPALLNLPCVLLGLARHEWVPTGMLPEFWRSITWPLIGAVFWWIAGRGIEALIASRWCGLSPRMTWAEVIAASLVTTLGVLICIGFLSDPSMRADCIFPWPGAAAASGLWILLGATTVTARLVQWRVRKKQIR
jgi:hypothetical protein